MTHFLRFFRKLFLMLFLLLIVVIIGTSYYMTFELPNIDALNTVQLQVPLQIFSQDNKLIATFGEKRRIPLPYSQIPQPLIQAVLATEDQRYFQHPGVDAPGLMRAAIQLLLTGRKSQGGSTITMQVARSFYLTRHKTFGRKLREILLALKIENKLTKQKILELYLNKVFLGNRAYGVEAASEIYYGKSLNQLSIDQYAMLAGLPKAPSTLNPLVNPIAAKKRSDHVLTRMYELSYIDEKTYKSALHAPLGASYHDLQTQVKAPYVAELARQQMQQMYGDGIYTDGYKAYTTIDGRLQSIANQSVRDGLIAYDQRHGYRGPEGNLGVPSITGMTNWERQLAAISTINGLEPAAVVERTKHSITVLRSDGSFTTIPWEGLSWARKQVNADFLGPRPKTSEQIVTLGDLVRIMSTPEGWRLAQIPKADAGLVTLNPQNGAILTMVGGFDYQVSKFNRITSATRQPGSSFKPFIYSAALDKGYTLATVINDAPIVIENPIDNSLWRPQNAENRFYGPTRLREALAHSRNLVSIRLMGLIGTSYAVNYAQRFGFGPHQLPPVLSLALGTATFTPLQLSQAYSVFANGGFRIVPYIIDSVHSTQDRVIYQAKPLFACNKCSNPTDKSYAPRVISAQNAFLITSALHDVIQYGTASQAKSLNREDLAGKTGTTNNQVDAWFAGYNSSLVTVAWIGFNQQQSLHEFGAQAALPIWIEFMLNALKGTPDRSPEQPTDIVSIRIDPTTGKRTTAKGSAGFFEYFMKPYLPEKTSSTDSSDANLPSSDDTSNKPEESEESLY